MPKNDLNVFRSCRNSFTQRKRRIKKQIARESSRSCDRSCVGSVEVIRVFGLNIFFTGDQTEIQNAQKKNRFIHGSKTIEVYSRAD